MFSNEFKFKNEDYLLFAFQNNKLQIFNEYGDNTFNRSKDIGTVLISKGYSYDI